MIQETVMEVVRASYKQFKPTKLLWDSCTKSRCFCILQRRFKLARIFEGSYSMLSIFELHYSNIGQRVTVAVRNSGDMTCLFQLGFLKAGFV